MPSSSKQSLFTNFLFNTSVRKLRTNTVLSILNLCSDVVVFKTTEKYNSFEYEGIRLLGSLKNATSSYKEVIESLNVRYIKRISLSSDCSLKQKLIEICKDTTYEEIDSDTLLSLSSEPDESEETCSASKRQKVSFGSETS